jgi:hypothetical protein
MAFNENIDFWNNQTVASGESMSEPLEKLLENDNYLKNKSDENEPKVFFAEYEITTFEEVTNALAANKMVFLRKIITVSEENHVIYLPLSNKKTSEPNVYTFSGISGHRGDLVISFTLSENDIWSLGNDSFPSKQIQVVAYDSTSLTDINSYFNKGLYLVCNRGNEYLPLIRRSLINDSYEYIFSGSYEDKVVKLKCEVSGWSEEVIGLKIIKDNAYDSVTDPINSDNITDIEQLTFIRNVGVDANYTMVESEKRSYGVLIPAPSLQADHGKVPMLNSLGQIVWETVPSPEFVSAEIADAVATVKTNNIFTIPLGSIQKVIAPEGTGTLYSYWTIISPSMDFPLSEKTTLSFLIKQLGTCTKAYLAIYEIDIYNQKKKWVANTNDFHASLALGYNYVNLAYINSSARLSSDKFYYICLISNINSFQFAGNSYDTQFNGVPRLANKIDNVNAEFNAATMQTVYAEFGLTEGSEILDRLFFNISNVERIVDPVAPTPFVALTNITLGHTKNVGNLVPAATTFGANGILYQKVIPQMDITIKSVWVLDYHSSQNAALLSLFILDEDLNSITSVNVPTLTNAGTSEKIGNYYVHKYAFSTPITLQEGKGYWMPAIGNCSNGTSEWAIQYTAADPSIPIRDMLAVSDITNFAIADKVIANNKNGCYLKLIDTTDTEWQI